MAKTKMRALTTSRKAPEFQPTLTDTLRCAKSAGGFAAVWSASQGWSEALCHVDPNNDRPGLGREANTVNDAAVWGLIRTRAAYSMEVMRKLEIYRDLLDQGDWHDNRDKLLLESAILDLTGGSMELERKEQDTRAAMDAAALKARAGAK